MSTRSNKSPMKTSKLQFDGGGRLGSWFARDQTRSSTEPQSSPNEDLDTSNGQSWFPSLRSQPRAFKSWTTKGYGNFSTASPAQGALEALERRLSGASDRKSPSGVPFEAQSHSQAPPVRANDHFGRLNRQKPSIALQVPNELWAEIFMIAAPPSLPFDTSASQHLNSHPASFLSQLQSSHLHLVTDYKDSMQSKCNLTLICKQFHDIGVQTLLQSIWITCSRDAGLLAKHLKSDACRRRYDTLYNPSGYGNTVEVGGELGIGVHIKRLHIETMALDRCAPEDIITILDHAPSIHYFRDLQSIYRNPRVEISLPRHRNDMTPSRWRNPARIFPSLTSNPHKYLRIVRLDDSLSHQGPSLHILSTLLCNPDRNTGLRFVSWTFYDYDEEEGSQSLEEWVVPNFRQSQEQLEFLEVILLPGGSSSNTLDTFFNPLQLHNTTNLKALSTTLGLGVTVTVTTETESMADTRQWNPTQDPLETASLVDDPESDSGSGRSSTSTTLPLSLPAMRSLKFTANNTALNVLSSWDMPNLHNLALMLNMVSIPGASKFERFFVAHGSSLTQLELGPLSQCLPSYGHILDMKIYHNAITTWCPNLMEFICTADEEWNEVDIFWTPHALLGAHPNIQIIAIRNLDRRIIESIQTLESRDPVAFLADSSWHNDVELAAGYQHSLSAFSGLIGRLRHLIDRKSFPNLRALRDLSPSLHHTTNTTLPTPIAPISPKGSPPFLGALALASRVVDRMRTALLASGLTKRQHQRHSLTADAEATQRLRGFHRRKAEQEFWVAVGKMSLFNGVLLQDHQGHVVAIDSL